MHTLFLQATQSVAAKGLPKQLKHLHSDWSWNEAGDDVSMSLRHILEDTAWLQEKVAALKVKKSAPRTRVAASLFLKKLLKNLITPMVAVYAITQRTPQFDYNNLILCPELKKPVSWKGSAWYASTDDFYPLMAQMLEDVHQVFKQELGLSSQIFWSTAALYLNTPWTRLPYREHDVHHIAQQASHFLTKVHPELSSQVDWLYHKKDTEGKLKPRRKVCCLKYVTSSAKFCGTCPLGRNKDVIALQPA